MKQTNNALTFLMAQYRAIFKNAYFKGLTSALVLTAGLAAAQGAAASGELTSFDSASGSSGGVINIISGGDASSGNYSLITVSGSGSQVLENITSITIKNGGTTTSGNYIQASGGDLNVNLNDAALTISGSGNGLLINGSGGKVSLTTTSDIKLESSGSLVLQDNTNLKVGSLTVAGASEVKTSGSGQSTIDLTSGADFSSSKLTVNSGAVLTINNSGSDDIKFSGATVTVSDNLTLNGGTFNFEGATLSGSKIIVLSDNTTANYKEGSGSGSLYNFLSGSGSVFASGSNSVINVSGNLKVDGTNVKLDNTSGSGSLGLADGSTLNVDTLTLTSGAGSDINAAINAGTLSLNGDFSGSGGLYNVTAEKLLNSKSSSGDVTISKTLNIASKEGVTGQISGSSGGFTLSSGANLGLTGTWESTAGITVSGSGAVLALENGADLTFKNSKLTINSGDSTSINVGEGAKLTLDKGTLEVINAEVDLSKLDIGFSNEGGTVTVSGSSAAGKIIINDFDPNGTYVANASGSFEATDLTVAANAFKQSTPITAAGVYIKSGGSLIVDNLSLTGSGDSLIGGTVKVKNSITGENDISFSGGTLQLGDDDEAPTEAGTIGNNLQVKNNTKIFGTWASAEGKTVTVGKSGSLTIGEDAEKIGTLTTNGLAFTTGNSGAMVNSGSTLTVNGTIENVTLDANSGADTLGLAESATLNVDTLKLTEDATNEVKATINAKTLDLNGATVAKLSNVIVSEKLNNSSNEAITLGNTVKLYQAETESGSVPAGQITGNGFTLTADNTFDIQGTWESTADINVSGTGASLKLDSGDSLTFNKAALALSDNGSVTVKNSGNLAFAAGSSLNLNGGSLTAEKANVDLSTTSVSASGSNTLTATNNGVIKFNDDTAKNANIKFVANQKGKLQTGTLNIKTTDIGSSEGVRFNISDGTLEVNNLILSDSGNLALNGTLQIDSSISAGSNDISFQGGTLQLGYNSSDGSISNNGTISSNLKLGGNSTTNVFGTWSASGKKLTVNSATLNIGNGVASGNLTSQQIEADETANIYVNSGSSLTVTGTETKVDTEHPLGSNGYYGFALDGVNVNVNGGTFVIGNTAVGGMLNNAFWKEDPTEDEKTLNTSQEYVYNNFGKYTLTNNGTLQLNFASGITFSLEQFNQMKTELFGTDTITGGSIDIGQATIDGLTNPDNGIIAPPSEGSGSSTLDFSTYNQYSNQFANVADDVITNTQVTNVDGNLYSTNFGSVKLAENGEVNFVGDSSLNTAVDGKLVQEADGSTGDANLSAGSNLKLNGDGAINDVFLADGSKGNVTTLNANNANTLNSVIAVDEVTGETLDYTNFVVASDEGSVATANVAVTEQIVVGQVTNNGQLTVAGDNVAKGENSIVTNSLGNNGTLAVTNGGIKINTGNLTNTGTDSKISVDFGDVVLTDGKLINEGSLNLGNGNLTVKDNISNTGSVNVAKGIVGSSGNLSNEGELTVAQGVIVGDEFTNKGTMSVSTGCLDEKGTVNKDTGSYAILAENDFANAGTLEVTNGNVKIASGNLSNTAEANFTIAKGDLRLEQGALSNAGNIELTSGELYVKDSLTTDTGSTITAQSILINGDNNNQAGASVIAGTVKVTDINADADISNINDPESALDNPNNASFYLDSRQLDSHGDIIKAQISGEVDASLATADLANTDITADGKLQARTALLGNDVIIKGNLNAERTIIGSASYNRNETDSVRSTRAGEVYVTGKAAFGELSFINGVQSTNAEGETVTTTQRSALHIFGGEVTTTDVFGAAGALIAVGSDKIGSQESTSGTLEITGVFHQNGANLVVDPVYGEQTALVAIRNLEGYNNSQNKPDIGVFEGNVFVGQNSTLGVGISADNLRNLIAQFQINGSLKNPAENEDAYGAILYLDGHTRIDKNYGITLTADSIDSARKRIGLGSNAYALANTIYLGSNTALAINTDKAWNDNTAYIRFVDTDADKNEISASGSKVIADGGEILLYGNTFSRTYKIFEDNVDINGLKGASGFIEVSSVNGLLEGVINPDDKGVVELTINKEKANVVLNGASAPVKETLLSYVRGYNGDLDSDLSDDDKTDYLYVYDSEGNKITTKDNGRLINNEFLSEVILGGNGSDAEKVARLGIYAGAAQAAITAGATTYDAVSGRMGVGANGTNLTVADNMQGGALWLTPIYKSNDSDGFDSEGVDYGVDMDLYGLALGADYTMPNGVRVGAAFNVGSGDADGDGAGSGVSNDFNYYGFSVYGGYSFGPWSVVADLSYTTVDNDIDVNTSQGKGHTSLDSTNFSLGVTGQYQIDVNGLLVTPHAGLRFTQIDFDDYEIKGDDGNAIASYEADSMSVFSIPVGVTIAKEFVNGSWTIKPSVDLTLTCNFGDDEMEGTTHWHGIENLATPVASEVLDNFTYGATVGVAAKSGNFSLGFGLNYTGSSNTDEFGLNANARFVF